MPTQKTAPSLKSVPPNSQTESEAETRAPEFNEDIKVIVKDFEFDHSRDADGRRRVSMQVQVNNDSATPIWVTTWSFTLKDQDGNVYPTDYYFRKTGVNHLEVHPGDSVVLWVVFRVSPKIVMEKSFIRYDKRPDGYSSDCLQSDWFSLGK